MLPAIVSYSILALVIVLPMISPSLGAWYVLAIVAIMFARAIRSAIDLSRGYRRLRRADRVNWHERLRDLEDPEATLRGRSREHASLYEYAAHRTRLQRLVDHPEQHLPPSSIVHAVIVTAYNESYDVIVPTIRTLANCTTAPSALRVFLAYEERGGAEMAATATRLEREFHGVFGAFELVPHPAGLPDELAGKGANLTFAGHAVQAYMAEQGIDPANVLVTSLDCDNKPHRSYFDCAAYYFAVNADRTRTSFQPQSLFLNNIWDAPAPTRVIASGNTFWNLTSSMRPLTLRNFASHSQPLDALIEMGFWSKRTIVEDGHQYWRSYFHFKGKYSVVAIPVPIYQDAVLAGSYKETLVAQFKQLSRWSYGASDVPYVATRTFGRRREAPFWSSLWRLASLFEGHVTLACLSVIVAVGGWLPVLIAGRAARHDHFVQSLPYLVSTAQQIAMIGLVISIVLAWRMLPPRPERYGAFRNVGMLAQWLLFPVTIIAYNATTALYSQGRLLIGKYRERFDVTAKSTVPLGGNRTLTSPIPITASIPLPGGGAPFSAGLPLAGGLTVTATIPVIRSLTEPSSDPVVRSRTLTVSPATGTVTSIRPSEYE